MTAYYVAGSSGSDGAAGTSTGTAWATIDKAANTVAAGDTVWIKPGVYRELVTMDTAGSSGSTITYNGDFDGAKFGTVGPVIISAWDDDTSTPTRASCWDMNGKTFIVVNKIQFVGGTSWAVGNTAFGSATAYEGCEFNDCVLQGSGTTRFALRLELNAGVTPTGAGLTLKRCALLGKSDIDWDSNGSAHVNVKWLFERCLFLGATAGTGTFTMDRTANSGAFSVGGVTWNHCEFYSAYQAIYIANAVNTTNPFLCYNCKFAFIDIAITYLLGASGGFLAANNIFSCVSTAYSDPNILRSPDNERVDVPLMAGGLNDWLYYQTYGWSPFKPWEPVKISSIYTDPSMDYGTKDITASTDIYGLSTLGRPSVYGHIYYFDGSDAAVTDPNNVWTTETSITADRSLTTFGTSSTNGSTSSNYVMAEGTNAPSGSATILNVYVRMYHKWGVSNGSNAGELKIYTDALGELLATVAQSTTGTTATWTSWNVLTTPTGGWTWAKVQALEFKAYRTAGSTTFQIAMIQAYVATAEPAPDAGMVEGRTGVIQDTVTYDEGASSGRMEGTDYHDFIGVAVLASSVSISVRARYDSNYTGTLPQMVISQIAGVADQTVTAVGSANTWETLTATFTPTAACLVNIRLKSNDTSATGQCWFDKLDPPVY